MNMYHAAKTELIHGIEVFIEQRSPYPIPWSGSKESRPADYYSTMATTLTYDNNGTQVSIDVPAVPVKENRRREIQVKVNGVLYPFNQAGLDILDMNKTFDIVEMEKLLRIAHHCSDSEDGILRACTPFFYMPEAKYTASDDIKSINRTGWVQETNGSLKKLILPYLDALKKSVPGKRKELYIPVVTYGAPHHWNLCLLSFDEQDIPSLTYVEPSGNMVHAGMLQQYVDFYKRAVLPDINAALAQYGYPTIRIDDMLIDIVKQFSEEGCGIALSTLIEKGYKGTGVRFADCIDYSKRYPKTAVQFKEKQFSYTTLEEDMLRRVQLAFSLSAHDDYIAQSQSVVEKKERRIFEAVLRELKTHPHSLAVKAKETLPIYLMNANDLAVFRQQWDALILDLKAKVKPLVRKGCATDALYNPQYKKAALAASTLITQLEQHACDFFNEPAVQQLQLFQKHCGAAIELADKEFNKHRGVWGRLNPCLKNILGVLAALTIIPAAIVSFKSPLGYRDTFFRQVATKSSEVSTQIKDDLNVLFQTNNRKT